MADVVPVPLLPAAPPDLLQAVLETALTGFILFRPLYDPAAPAAIIDFAYEYLNPAAQRMLQLPERPAGSFLTLYPRAVETGIFAFYRDTFRAGGAGRYDVNYQHDGLDNYFHLAGRRAGEWLVVSFSDTADQPRTAVEEALRQSQTREQQARAEAEHQREELQRLFEQAPVALAVFQGPRYVVAQANPEVLRLWGRTREQALGTPLFELLPEITGQGFQELLDQVVATGVPHVAHEMPSTIDRHGRRDTVYWNFVYQPLRGATGAVTGITVVATEVSEQVVARRQLQLLNKELEARVLERTQALHQAQAGAEAAVQRLRYVTESLPSTSFTADATGQVLAISPQWYAYTGMTPDTPITEAWPDLLHPDDLPVIAQEYTAALAAGRPWRYEFRLRGADGRYRWFASQGVPEPLEEARAAGRPRQWFGSNLDIDDLKQAQVAQQRQEQLLASILSSLPAGVITFTGEELRASFFNDTFQQQVQGRAVLGRPIAELFPEATERGDVEPLRGVLRSGVPHRTPEAPSYVPDPRPGEQQELFLDRTYLPLRHGQEPPHAVLGFTVDVTERVRARWEREAQRQQLAAVFAQAPVAICVFRGPAYVLDLVNPPMTHMLGRPLAALQGRPFFDALPELRAQGLPALLDEVRHTGVRFVAEERAVQLAHHAPGTPGYYNFVYEPQRDERGAVAAIICVATDVTEQVRSRRQVQQLNQDLTAANQQLTRTNVDLDTFIYTASHDLKAPITNIEGLLATLRDELPALEAGSEIPYILDLMQDSVERFRHTIHHLTDVSRLQQAHHEPASAVPLAAVVDGVRLDLAPLLQQTGAQLSVEVQAVPTLLFSEKNLRSVVFNLLSNALKYRHPDRPPQVRVHAWLEVAHSVLQVQDNGLGFEMDREAQVFAMFQRLHPHVEGSGVGLYMVKRLVENVGGHITVTSSVGTGSTFTVYFPR